MGAAYSIDTTERVSIKKLKAWQLDVILKFYPTSAQIGRVLVIYEIVLEEMWELTAFSGNIDHRDTFLTSISYNCSIDT